MSKEQTQHQKDNLRVAIVQRFSDLLTAALSLVAALAWNDAIQSIFRTLFGEMGTLYAKLIYAIGITIFTVILVTRLAKILERLKNGINRTANN